DSRLQGDRRREARRHPRAGLLHGRHDRRSHREESAAEGLMPLPTHLQLQIVSADRSLVNEQVDEVEVPGSDGYFGVLPGHTPLLALLGAGELWYRQGQERHYFAIGFGFAEVQPDRVTILAQIAEKADEIDVARAELAKKRAEERMTRPTVDMDFERARIALLKALARLQVASRARIRS